MAGDGQIQHLLRRAGFGASPAELPGYEAMGFTAAVNHLVNYENVPDTVDSLIGAAGYAGTTSRGAFQPNTNLTDARQRWLFRMVHSPRPLQEKMTLFWHNHFATALQQDRRRVRRRAGDADDGGQSPPRTSASSEGRSSCSATGALGNFRDLLLAVAQDPAMLVWLDGETQHQGQAAGELRPRADGAVHDRRRVLHRDRRLRGGARLHRLEPAAVGGSPREDPTAYFEFVFNAGQHETSAKTFSFPIYRRRRRGRSRRGRPPTACRTAST